MYLGNIDCSTLLVGTCGDMLVHEATKVTDGPFPWPRPPQREDERVQGLLTVQCHLQEDLSTSSSPSRWPRLPEVHVDEAHHHPDLVHDKISFALPKRVTTSGSVLKHATNALNSLFNKFYPCTFKIGFTCDPVSRWENTKYGYRWERERWEGMLVVFRSHEPFSPAMLEAALIDKFSCTLASHKWRLAVLSMMIMIQCLNFCFFLSAQASLAVEMCELVVTASQTIQFQMRHPTWRT